jgi:hypothetical protein
MHLDGRTGVFAALRFNCGPDVLAFGGERLKNADFKGRTDAALVQVTAPPLTMRDSPFVAGDGVQRGSLWFWEICAPLQQKLRRPIAPRFEK